MHSTTTSSPTTTTPIVTVSLTPADARSASRQGGVTRLERAGHSRLGRTLLARNLGRRSDGAAIRVAPVRGDVPAEPGFRNPLAPFAPAVRQRVLIPVIGANDELTPAWERAIAPIVARAASGDRIARDALYAAFEPKLMRFVRGVRVPWAPTGAVDRWDRDDVAQEAYLAFLDVLATWEEPIPFGRYVFAHFPWRLRDLVYRGVARSSVPPGTIPVAIEGREWLADDSAAALESRMLLDALATSFGPPYDDIIRWHIGDGASLMAVAARLGRTLLARNLGRRSDGAAIRV
ncbi:MAG: sigma-70 family RNA polymerase sigma factor, partial [Thermomicrobiales bacterium]